MKSKSLALFTVLLSVTLLALLVSGSTRTFAAPATAGSEASAGSIMFVENVGQFAGPARFQINSNLGTMWLASDGLWATILEEEGEPVADIPGELDMFTLPASEGRLVNLHLSFVGANPAPQMVPFNRLPTHRSYFYTSDPANWYSDVPVWGGVRYVDIYPGVDLELSSAGDQLTQRFVCRANCAGSLAGIRLQVDGADSVALQNGSIALNTGLGSYSLPLFQLVDSAGNLMAVSQAASLAGNVISAPFSNASAGAPAAPDNLGIIYSTFLGGSAVEYGLTGIVDGSGQAFVTGYTRSTDFPVTVGMQDASPLATRDAFLVKMSADGSTILFSTLLGGSGAAVGTGIEVDDSDYVYVSGYTESASFPVTPGAFDTTYNGNSDAFALKLTPDGTTMVYSTYLGGSDQEETRRLALDDAGRAVVAGFSYSTDFPTTAGVIQPTYQGDRDGFLLKLAADGSSLVWSTYIGGTSLDTSYVPITLGGTVFLSGRTASADFPVTGGAYDTTFNGDRDVFVLHINYNATSLLYATYLGGAGNETGYGLAVDDMGYAYVAGHTFSSNFDTTAGSYDPTFNGGPSDSFAAKFSQDGSSLIYSTYIGGDGDEATCGVDIDADGNVYVGGFTTSSNYPTTPGAHDTTLDGSKDIFFTKLNATGTALDYSTYLGGVNGDHGHDISVDSAANAYVFGKTQSPDFPTTVGAYDTSHNGAWDTFITKFGVESGELHTQRIKLAPTVNGGNARIRGSVLVADSLGAPVDGATVDITWTLPGGGTVSDSALTGANGVAGFQVIDTLGTYTLTIDNVTKTGYTWTGGDITSKSITVP